MKVRYTRRALRQMTSILDYIEAQSPQGAWKVKTRLQSVTKLLLRYPNSGRSTNKSHLRRILASPYPYAIFYRPDAKGIVIHTFDTLLVVRSQPSNWV